jgi:hypothetical protein
MLRTSLKFVAVVRRRCGTEAVRKRPNLNREAIGGKPRARIAT